MTSKPMPEHAAPGSEEPYRIRDWAKAAGVRAVKTAAQAALAAIPTSAVTIGTVNWPLVSGTAALAAIASVLTSIAGVPEVRDGASVKQIASE